MHADSFDSLIDRVARDATAADLPDGFAARVDARLDAGTAARPGVHRLASRHVVAPLALAATIAAAAGAVWVDRAIARLSPPPPIAMEADRVAAAPAAARAAAGAARAFPDAGAARRADDTRRAGAADDAAAADAAALAEWEARAIPALAEAPALALEALETPAIQPPAVTLPLLSVDPLPARPVMIAPLAAGRAGTQR